MGTRRARAVLLAACCAPGRAADGGAVGRISGRVLAPEGSDGPLWLHAYELREVAGVALPITAGDVYRDLDPRGTTSEASRLRVTRVQCGPGGGFGLAVDPARRYGLFAWQDRNGNGELDLREHEPLGWFARGGAHWMSEVRGGDAGLEVRVDAAAPVPSAGGGMGIFGRLLQVRGLLTLQVWGTPKERGYAHGWLLGRQVLDFFRFFTLEATTDSRREYEEVVLPFVETAGGAYAYEVQYLEEVLAILEGMRASPSLASRPSPLHVPELQRDLRLADLLYLNDYGARPQGQPRAPRECTQFAFWGERSEGGGIIAGRNMDGENDIRKVTVSHFLAHAVVQPDGASFVHFMWPGFVAVASGVNQRGLWVMMNDGSSPEHGPQARRATPYGWTVRQMLARAETVNATVGVVAAHAGETGGTCPMGCNLLVAQAGQPGSGPGAAVLESDRFNNSWRLPGLVEPLISQGIMVANHEYINGYDERAPLDNFGKQVYFSSLWRYEAGKNFVNALAEYGRKIGVSEMQRLLQAVTHASTEHSIIYEAAAPQAPVAADREANVTLHVSVADLRVGGWHAPYLPWKSFALRDFFAPPPPQEAPKAWV